jgi:uncharacterized protein (DUF1697 family)
MTTYIALLRGVNVVSNPVNMGELRAMLTELGYANVRTYINSGNAIFDASESAAQVQRDVEAALEEMVGRKGKVVIRTAAELSKVVKENPLLKGKKPEALKKMHVVFLEKAATAKGKHELAKIPPGETKYEVVGKHVYLYVPQGFAGTKIQNNSIEKALGVAATTRSWGTVTKLAELAAEK